MEPLGEFIQSTCTRTSCLAAARMYWKRCLLCVLQGERTCEHLPDVTGTGHNANHINTSVMLTVQCLIPDWMSIVSALINSRLQVN